MISSFRPRGALAAAAMIAVSGPTRPAHAQADTVRFELEHGARTARIADDHSRTLVDVLPNGRFRLRKPATIQVRVVNTNTALYSVSDSSSAVPVAAAPPTTDPVLTFITRTKPYLPELALAATGAARFNGTGRLSILRSGSAPAGMANVMKTAEELQASLLDLDAAMFGPRGVNQTFVMTLDALEHMRAERDRGAAVLRAFRDSLGVSAPACGAGRSTSPAPAPTDSLARRVLQTMKRLSPAVVATDATVAASALADLESAFMLDVNSLRARADTALRQADDNVARAYRVQRLASLVANGCTEYMTKPVTVADSARNIIVRIAPRSEPELARVAEGSASTTITVLPPRAIARTYLGLALIVAPNVKYPKYAARPKPGTTLQELYASEIRDGRYSYGVTLGTTWRALDFPDAPWAPAVWLPEVTIGEAPESKEFGLGAAVSAHDVKLGFGVLWYRHPVLADTLTPKSVLANAGYLVMRDAYGTGNWYVSLSLFNLGLFLPGAPK